MFEKKLCDIDMPVLGLGLMRLPKVSQDGDEIDYESAMAMVDYAIKNGIKYFDTAYPYHRGQSELFIGEALKKYPRESFYLASKMPIWECKTKEDVKNIFFKQLERCQVEYFDFYLCHAMSLDRYNVYKELDAFAFLSEMKEQGYIKNLGFSYHDIPSNLFPLVDELKWDFAQLQLNYLDWIMIGGKKQYDVLVEKNIPCIVMEPIRGGSLANVCQEAIDVLGEDSPAKWALRWVGSLDNCKVILSGMSNMEQLVENIDTFNDFKELSDSEMETIELAKQKILGNKFVPCTGCRYCMPCPFGVNIPRIFSMYNQYNMDKDREKFLKNYNELDAKERIDNCKWCNACVSHCPQAINIPEELSKIKGEIEE